jgi:hypothetical protein
VGTWGTGVFDNDSAGDFMFAFVDAEPSDRESVIREAFEAVTEAEDYVEVNASQDAIAAAAVVAAIQHNRPVIDDESDSAIPAADLPPATAELRAVAVTVLDRATGVGTEWRELWEETDDFDVALAAVNEVRSALT